MGYLGFAMAVPVAAGGWLGHIIDRRTGASGVFAVVGILLGVAAGGVSAYKVIMQALAEGTNRAASNDRRDDDRNERNDDGNHRSADP